MPVSTITGPDGKDYEVTHPAEATDAEVLDYARQNYGSLSSPTAPSSPETPTALETVAPTLARELSPDVVGRAKQWLTEEPTDPRARTVFEWEPTWPGKAVRAAGRFFLPETKGQAVTTGVAMVAFPGVGAVAPRLAARLGLGGTGAKLLGAGSRIAAGAGAGATGPAIDEGDIGTGAAVGGGITGALETAVPALSWLRRIAPGAKARIAERLAKGVRSFAETQVPELATPISAAKRAVKPTLLGGRTGAALEETALGESGKRTLSEIMEQGMLDTSLLSVGGTGVRSQALEKAWQLLPGGNGVARELKNRLRPAGGQFNISQAERVLAELGEAAFKGEAGSPIARRMGGLELRKLYGDALDETVASLPPQAAQVFAATRDKFKSGLALMDMIRQTAARQAGPNRVILNEPALQKYISENRAELRIKFGAAFDDLVEILGRGGQLGTRSIMTPGTGETTAALRQVYGRGQGGAPQLVGSVIRTAAPNIGYQPTGRAPYAPPEGLQIILDILGIAAAPRLTP